MTADNGHFAVVIGASGAAEELRRSLMRGGVAHAGIASHLRGLRQRLLTGRQSSVVLCVALDRTTLHRHGRALRTLLADIQGMPGAIRSVGLVTDEGLTSRVAQVGCDIYVQSATEAIRAIECYRNSDPCRGAPTSRRHVSMDNVADHAHRTGMRLNRTRSMQGDGIEGAFRPAREDRIHGVDWSLRRQRYLRSSRTERPATGFWDFDVSL